MKTQLTTNRIFAIALSIAIVAITALEVGAQQRNTNSERKSADRAVREVKSNMNPPREYKRPHDRDERRVHKESSNRDDRRYDDKRYGKHRQTVHNNKSDYHYKYHSPKVHVLPPRYSEKHYRWHRHHHVSFRTLPRKASWVFIDGVNYAYYRGKFYVPGPMGFYSVTPPVYLRNLPHGCVRIMMNGSPAWSLNGIILIETPFGFRIVV